MTVCYICGGVGSSVSAHVVCVVMVVVVVLAVVMVWRVVNGLCDGGGGGGFGRSSSVSVNHTGGNGCRWLVYMYVVFFFRGSCYLKMLVGQLCRALIILSYKSTRGP